MFEAPVTTQDDDRQSFAFESFAGPASPSLVNRLNDTARFAGRVAHDFDNVLMGVMGFAELAQSVVEPNSPVAEYLTELQRAAQRGQDATRQMHRFSRGGRMSPQPTRLDALWNAGGLEGVSDLPAGARLETSVAPDLPPVAMAKEHLLLVLAAVVRNAAEAMPAGGVVAISARMVDGAKLRTPVLPADLRPGPYIEVTVADHGPGFQGDVLRQLAEQPFVTTKVRHRGLGLATVLRTLHAHNGGLTIASTPAGSTVCIYLPPALTQESTPNDSSA